MLEGVATNETDELIAGEGVALLIPPAAPVIRICCGILDLVLYASLAILMLYFFIKYGPSLDEALIKAALILLMAFSILILPATVEYLSKGKSLGKLIGGMRVVRIDSGPIVWRQCFTRALMGLIEIWTIQAISVVSVLVEKRSRRVGDLAAGTYVIRERMPLRIPTPPQMPPQLEAWAKTVDLGGISPGLAIAMRQFITRRDLFSSAGGRSLAEQIMRQVYVAVLPRPPQAPPEQIIAALLAERTNRESTRLQAEERMRTHLLGTK